MGKITVSALPTEKEMSDLIQFCIDDDELDFSNEAARTGFAMLPHGYH